MMMMLLYLNHHQHHHEPRDFERIYAIEIYKEADYDEMTNHAMPEIVGNMKKRKKFEKNL